VTVARFSAQPTDTGLYRREHEHDACGVALVATMRGSAGHDIVAYFPSLSSRTVVYKGMFTTAAAGRVLPRPVRRALRVGTGAGAQPLQHQHLPVVAAGAPVPVHRPQRRDQHRAGQPQLDAHAREPCWPATCVPGLERAFPICTPGASDSATFDEVLELLHLGGRSLPHAVLMMIPEAWENHESMDAEKRRSTASTRR
jgi:glutamate synthase (NADPH/NADH) large chain